MWKGISQFIDERNIHKNIHKIKINKYNSQEVEDKHNFENKLLQDTNILQTHLL